MLNIPWFVLFFIVSLSVAFGYALACLLFMASKGENKNE